MNCKETQDKILLFLQESLETEELQLFLEHVESCKVCREELDVYYTLYTGMQILEKGTEREKNSYEIDLDKELERIKDNFKRAKRRKTQKTFIFILIIIIIGIFIL